MIKFLLDTNIVIFVLKRRPLEVLKIFNANASRVEILSVTFSAKSIGIRSFFGHTAPLLLKSLPAILEGLAT